MQLRRFGEHIMLHLQRKLGSCGCQGEYSGLVEGLPFAWPFAVWSHMTVLIPETFQDLLKPEARALAYLALVLSDGNPQVTPIWFDYDGTHFVFNTARSRLKDRVMRKWPVVAFAISDPRNAYRYLQVRGPVWMRPRTAPSSRPAR